MVVRGGSHFCQSPKSGGGQEFFNQNMREGQHFLSEKIPKFPIPPPPQEKTYLPLIQKTLSMKWGGGGFWLSCVEKWVFLRA